ncbi:hypothetical protein RKD27_003639 [Streptomyces sp. SAI-126]|jgi:hypothetical protein|uniref:hypothetical protein n=1 Tax=Streptomyces sp. SAI-126 TaxID=3377732 RepID=UPI003C7BABF5
MPKAELIGGLQAQDWNQALRALALTMADDTPNVTVIDEVPWPVEQDREFEGALQTVWDRHLSSKPVLFLLVGSDVSVMEGLLSYGRPFFSRAARLTARPLNLADVQAMTDSSVGEAVDAHLPTRASRRSRSHGGNERASAANPLSPAGGRRLSLLGEFPEASPARAVLEAVGSGERMFSAIAARPRRSRPGTCLLSPAPHVSWSHAAGSSTFRL